MNSNQYQSGQVNVTSLQVKVVTADVRSLEEQSDYDESNVETAMYSFQPPSQSAETVDVKSCLRLLLELFAQWLDVSVSSRPPVMLVFEIVKSAVTLSDVFEELWHFEWLLEHCLRLAAAHVPENEQIYQYLILGACKASAILRIVKESTCECVTKLALSGLTASHESTQVLTLHGILYVLEAHSGADMGVLLPTLADYITSLLLETTCGECQLSEEHQLVLWSTAFFLVEQYSDNLKLSDFSSRVVKVALVSLSMGDVLPLSVYSSVSRCLERLLLSFSLSKSDREAVPKVALERHDTASFRRSLPALGLLLTQLYTGRSGYQAGGISQMEGETLNDPGMEEQLAVLEKITKVLDRMHKALPIEAAVIAKILPTLLEDFLPKTQIVSKVVHEFLSSQQPYPGLMAGVMYKVFENLMRKKEVGFVTNWVLLSLRSFVQRTPLAMAVWSLNCLFVCCSLNGSIRAQFPCVVERVGHLDDLDCEFLAFVVKEFYYNRGLSSDDSALLVSVFRSVSVDHEVYRHVVSCLEESAM